MQEASDATVVADFNNVRFENVSLTSVFFRENDKFMVRTDGPDGKLHDYPIKYTFGVYPLQQYLIEFPSGRLQALAIAWDSRPTTEGGQRWFHLHPDEVISADDVLHWTGPNLNWNYMCADCHSTQLKKNYDAKTDSYDTRWAEINVACEACHGPGARHLQWAKEGQSGTDASKGLSVNLNERAGVRWRLDEKTGLPHRSEANTSRAEIEVCARCHSRRSQLSDAFVPGQPFLDAYRPSLLTAGLYHADGQIQDEVYVYGSFLQSRMHRAGVTCSDCHDPHAADLRQPGEQVCYQCHVATQYATRKHHHHPAASTGASCVECHMPATTFMGVDARHDHGFRVPRPDLSVTLGTPNACNNCHRDETPAWAATQLEAWYGKQPIGYQRYASALTAARQQWPNARALLQALAAEDSQPAIARATALAELGGYMDQQSLMQIQQSLQSDDALLRLGALETLASQGPRERVLAFALLQDSVRAVRIEAGRLLAGQPTEQLPAEMRADLQAAIDEYIATQTFNAERPEAQLNLGNLYAEMGQTQKAEAAYRRAQRQQPQFVPAYLNIAQLLSGQQREHEAEGFLRAGLKKVPQAAALHHALGLSLIRQKQYDLALGALAKAAQLEPANARFSYVYAVALNSTNKTAKALQVLQRAHQRHPNSADMLFALVTINREAGNSAAALAYARKLDVLLPGNPAVQRLLGELN